VGTGRQPEDRDDADSGLLARGRRHRQATTTVTTAVVPGLADGDIAVAQGRTVTRGAGLAGGDRSRRVTGIEREQVVVAARGVVHRGGWWGERLPAVAAVATTAAVSATTAARAGVLVDGGCFTVLAGIGRSRVEPHPAVVGEVHLDPDVRVESADEVLVLADGLAGRVAGRHPGGNTL
jgi:hypothetical protein